MDNPKFQYGNWLRVKLGQLNQGMSLRQNEIETLVIIREGQKGADRRSESTDQKEHLVMI